MKFAKSSNDILCIDETKLELTISNKNGLLFLRADHQIMQINKHSLIKIRF